MNSLNELWPLFEPSPETMELSVLLMNPNNQNASSIFELSNKIENLNVSINNSSCSPSINKKGLHLKEFPGKNNDTSHNSTNVPNIQATRNTTQINEISTPSRSQPTTSVCKYSATPIIRSTTQKYSEGKSKSKNVSFKPSVNQIFVSSSSSSSDSEATSKDTFTYPSSTWSLNVPQKSKMKQPPKSSMKPISPPAKSVTGISWSQNDQAFKRLTTLSKKPPNSYSSSVIYVCPDKCSHEPKERMNKIDSSRSKSFCKGCQNPKGKPSVRVRVPDSRRPKNTVADFEIPKIGKPIMADYETYSFSSGVMFEELTDSEVLRSHSLNCPLNKPLKSDLEDSSKCTYRCPIKYFIEEPPENSEKCPLECPIICPAEYPLKSSSECTGKCSLECPVQCTGRCSLECPLVMPAQKPVDISMEWASNQSSNYSIVHNSTEKKSHNNNSEMVYSEAVLMFRHECKIKNNLDFHFSILRRYEYDENPFSYVRCYYKDRFMDKTTPSQLQVPQLTNKNKSKIEQILINIICNNSHPQEKNTSANNSELGIEFLSQLIDESTMDDVSALVLSVFSLKYRWRAVRTYLDKVAAIEENKQSTNQSNKNDKQDTFCIYCNWLCDDFIVDSVCIPCGNLDISSTNIPKISKVYISLDAKTNLLTNVAIIPKTSDETNEERKNALDISENHIFANKKVADIIKLMKINANLNNIYGRNSSKPTFHMLNVKTFQRKVSKLAVDKVLFSFKLKDSHFDMELYKPVCEITMRETINFQSQNDFHSAKIFHRSSTPNQEKHYSNVELSSLLQNKVKMDKLKMTSESEIHNGLCEFIYIDYLVNNSYTTLNINWTDMQEERHILTGPIFCNKIGRTISEVRFHLADKAVRQSCQIQPGPEVFQSDIESVSNWYHEKYGFICQSGKMKVFDMKIIDNLINSSIERDTTIYCSQITADNSAESIRFTIPQVKLQNGNILESLSILTKSTLCLSQNSKEKRKSKVSANDYRPNIPNKLSNISHIHCCWQCDNRENHSLVIELPQLLCHGYFMEELKFVFQHVIDSNKFNSLIGELQKASKAKFIVKSMKLCADDEKCDKCRIVCVWKLNNHKVTDYQLNTPLIQLPQLNRFAYEIKLLFSMENK